ncbi:hypothetical protein NQ317_015758 [Molorchus minor]|uniref:Uncharacterized protein n=1 Tax=Molorchus minor TaxID=1323400 RepID=A0ABQ9K547_9CUCU|nr:hypothetical protein NQ317_015758 [Molorchus minor]
MNARLCLLTQNIDLMNREKEDQLPLMQSFAVLSDKLDPLVEGVQKNRQKWLEIAAENCLVPPTVAGEERDDNDNLIVVESNVKIESTNAE